MKLVDILDEHFGTNNGESIESVLRKNPEALAEWMTEQWIIRPENVWRLSFPAERSGSRFGPSSMATSKYLFDDPETTPLEGADRFGKLTRLFTVKGTK